jgi:hypothetical protein
MPEKPDGRELSRLKKVKADLRAAAPINPGTWPELSPLRLRIRELELTSGGKWNGKFYGGPGTRYFYVAGDAFPATDEEIAIRAENILSLELWILAPFAPPKTTRAYKKRTIRPKPHGP